MTEIEELLLEELYFVTPYKELLQSLSTNEQTLLEGLQRLLQRQYLHQLSFTQGDFVPNSTIDFHDLTAYAYLATKKGLLHLNRFTSA